MRELAKFVGPFSARARQIANNIEGYEAQWRAQHPGEQPGPELARAWDRRAWAQARPDKVIPTDGEELTDRWVDELYRLGYRDPQRAPVNTASITGSKPGALDREAAVHTILSRLGTRRSGWNAADVRGEAEQLIARTGIVTEAAVRRELAEDLTARVLEDCVPLLPIAGARAHPGPHLHRRPAQSRPTSPTGLLRGPAAPVDPWRSPVLASMRASSSSMKPSSTR